MSSSPTALTSTTGSSSSCSSQPEVTLPEVTLPEVTLPEVTLPEVTLPEAASPLGAQRQVGGIARGALGGHIREVAARRGAGGSTPREPRPPGLGDGAALPPVAAAQSPGPDRSCRRAAGPRPARTRAASGTRLRGLRQLRCPRLAVRAAQYPPPAGAALL